ncbi:MAG: DUF4013 domain-containing protein [Candidatus Woesearchaeota archaeon]
MDILGAIKRPFSSPRKFLVGVMLLLVPFVNILTSFFAYGYMFYSTKAVFKKQKRLPEWNNWEELFVKGILISLITLIYILPAAVLITSFGLAAVWAVVTEDLYNITAIGAGMLVAIAFTILTLFALPGAIVNYVKENKYSKAFDIATILRKAFTAKYSKAWLFSMLYIMAAGIPLSYISYRMFSTIIVPFLAYSCMTFALAITTLTLVAEAWDQ